MIENTILSNNEEDSDDEFILEDDSYKPDDSLGIKSTKSNVIYYDGQETITNLFYDKLSYVPNRQHFCNDEKGLAPNNKMGLKGLAPNNRMLFMPNDIIDTIGRDGKYVMIIYII